MSRVPDTAALIQEIREQTNEHNEVPLSDAAILRVMNRGLRYVTSELARTWEEPLVALAYYSASTYDPDVGFPLPDDAFEERITYVRVDTPAAPTPIPARSYSQVSALDVRGSRSFIPAAYYQKGRALFLVPRPASTYPILVDYVRLPDSYVKPIGRVSDVNLTANSVVLEDINLDLISAASDQRKSFVNVIDGLTGIVKFTMQVARIDGSLVTFRTVPTRTTIDARPISTTMDPLVAVVDADDYLCSSDGTCVSQLGQAFVSYIVEYAAAEIGRSLNDSMVQISASIAKRAEEAARQQRQGRPNVIRVKNRSKVWGAIRPSAYPYVPT